MSGEKCSKWFNGTLRNYILFAGVILTAGGSGWGIFMHLDNKITYSSEHSYSRKEGEMLETQLSYLREDVKDVSTKIDVLLGIKPRSALNDISP